MKQKRTGVLIGPALTEKYGWKEGDRVPLKSLLSANRDRSSRQYPMSGIGNRRQWKA